VAIREGFHREHSTIIPGFWPSRFVQRRFVCTCSYSNGILDRAGLGNVSPEQRGLPAGVQGNRG